MHKLVFVPNAECYVPYVQGFDEKLLSSQGSHWRQPLYSYGRGKAVYIYPTFVLLLVGFTEYDDDDDLLHNYAITIRDLWSHVIIQNTD
ncbi:hypothetical protein Hanom_Chr10g00904581 [Helianthus anomalus]